MIGNKWQPEREYSFWQTHAPWHKNSDAKYIPFATKKAPAGKVQWHAPKSTEECSQFTSAQQEYHIPVTIAALPRETAVITAEQASGTRCHDNTRDQKWPGVQKTAVMPPEKKSSYSRWYQYTNRT